jgi:peroxiredoxin
MTVGWLVWSLLFGPWPWVPLGFAGVTPETLGAERFVLLAAGLSWTLVLGLTSTKPSHAWNVMLLGVLLAAVALVAWAGRLAVVGMGPWYEVVTPGFALICIGVYGGILREQWREFRAEGRPGAELPEGVVEGYLEMATTARGDTLAELSHEHPVLVIFLRHFGCTFCREALADIAARRREIERRGTRIVLVHMSDASAATEHLASFGLESIDHVQDSECELYRVFGLERGSLLQVFGWREWARGAHLALLHRHGIGWLEGDGFRMPGVFLLRHGRVIRSFRHTRASARPDYVALADCTTMCGARPGAEVDRTPAEVVG